MATPVSGEMTIHDTGRWSKQLPFGHHTCPQYESESN